MPEVPSSGCSASRTLRSTRRRRERRARSTTSRRASICPNVNEHVPLISREAFPEWEKHEDQKIGKVGKNKKDSLPDLPDLPQSHEKRPQSGKNTKIRRSGRW